MTINKINRTLLRFIVINHQRDVKQLTYVVKKNFSTHNSGKKGQNNVTIYIQRDTFY